MNICSVSPGWAQQEKTRIAKIDIEGNVSADKELIRLNSGLTVGSMVTGEDIQRALKHLYNLGIYSFISFWKMSDSPAGMELVIRVTEYPRAKQVTIEGNKEIKLKDVEEKLSLYVGQVVNPVALEKAVNRLKKLYVQKGFLLADIQTILTNTQGDTLGKLLTVKITEGSRVQVKKIRFHGNNTFNDKTLRKQMKEVKEDTWWRGADFKPEKYDKDKEKILAYYRNNGYRNAQILRDSLSYDQNKTDMFIDLFVEEGQRYYFGSTSFEGNKLYTPEKLRLGFEFSRGDVYNEEKFTKSIQNISKFYYDDGYIYAQVSPRETIVSSDTVNIHFTVEEGSPVRVNQILITGNTKTKEKIIRREIWLKPGEIFSNSSLERSQREVWILNYFANVNPSLKVLPDNQNLVDIIFQVEEKSTDTANMSAGYSQMDGLIGSIGVAMNNF
ncbi:MAG: outer membrane protein assembly factor BamA, partial [Patescibacteria group bacterium]|nr:outer membrane protein assembly factor BamA [Patescibacteria group bacterium]